MIHISEAFHNKLIANDSPEIYVIIVTHLGSRLYAMEVEQNDPTTVISHESLITQFGNIEHSLVSNRSDLLSGFTEKRQTQFVISLNNTDFKITKLMVNEPFLTRNMTVYLGYTSVPFAEHIKIFTGIIDLIEVSNTIVTLTAVES